MRHIDRSVVNFLLVLIALSFCFVCCSLLGGLLPSKTESCGNGYCLGLRRTYSCGGWVLRIGDAYHISYQSTISDGLDCDYEMNQPLKLIPTHIP
jgi:hypothetical protein